MARIIATKIAICEAEHQVVDRVIACMEAATQTLLDQPIIIIQVHPDLCAPLEKRLQQMGKTEGIKVVKGETLAMTDCQFSWGSGGAESSLQKTLQEIDDIIEKVGGR